MHTAPNKGAHGLRPKKEVPKKEGTGIFMGFGFGGGGLLGGGGGGVGGLGGGCLLVCWGFFGWFLGGGGFLGVFWGGFRSKGGVRKARERGWGNQTASKETSHGPDGNVGGGDGGT